MSDQADIDKMYHNIRLLFDYNPRELFPGPKAMSTTARSSFYDKHLDDRLTLKKTIIVPSLIQNISSSVDMALKSLEERHLQLPLSLNPIMVSTPDSRKRAGLQEPIVDAESVAREYQLTTARFCGTIASMLMLSPQAPQWDSFLVWKRSGLSRLEDRELWDEDFGLQLRDLEPSGPMSISENVINSLSKETLETLRGCRQRFPMLAIWDFLAPSPEAGNVLETISSVPSIFEHEKCLESGYISHRTPSLHTSDAVTTSWGPTVTSFSKESAKLRGVSVGSDLHDLSQTVSTETNVPVVCRRSEHPAKGATTSRVFQWPDVTIPSTPTESRDDNNSIAKLLLQRAWSRSVHLDSTFIVFHCGNFERIGFRHRATQTLFLSELIDVPHCKNPGYGKIQLGLYLSILHDVLDREKQLFKFTSGTSSVARKRRRSNPSASEHGRKRPKTRAAVAKAKAAESERHSILRLLKTPSTIRDLVFIQFMHEDYNSSNPAIFIKSGKTHPVEGEKYGPERYLSIVVTSDIAAGATGSVHGATLALLSPGGKTLTLDIVVKFSFQPAEQERMRHEFLVYEKLDSVEGVPDVIGLFEDLESDVIALVMTHAGTCLTDLYPESIETVVQEPERSAFLQILKDIHHAGVQHRDIRSENLSLDENGKAYIIDFDRAKINPTDGAKKRELTNLTYLLDGDATSNDLSSVSTTEEDVD